MNLSLRNFLIGLGFTVVSGAGAYTQHSLASTDHLPSWLVFLAPLIVMAIKDVTPLIERWVEKQGVHVSATPVSVTGAIPTINVAAPAEVAPAAVAAPVAPAEAAPAVEVAHVG